MTPAQVASRAGMARSTVHRIAHEETDPKISTLREIAIACGYDLAVSLVPLSDPDAATAARLLLEDGYAPASNRAVRQWVDRLQRVAGDDPLAIACEAAHASTLLHRAGARYFTGTVHLPRLVSEADHVSTRWALSGAPMLDGRGPAIVWTDNADALARLAAEHLVPVQDATQATVLIAPSHPDLYFDSFVEQSVRYVAPVQMILDSLGIPGPLAEDALAEAKRW